MEREQIIRMAREAGIGETSARFMSNLWEIGFEAGAAAEREACAMLENEPGIYTKHDMAEAIRARGQE